MQQIQYDNHKKRTCDIPIAPPQYQGQDDNYDDVLKNIYDVAPEIGELAERIPPKLRNAGLVGHKAKVCLILDISQSMQNPNKFFRGDDGSNKVARLVNNALALACFFDDDNEVEIIPFGRESYPITKVSLSNYQSVTDDVLKKCGGFSDGTNYAEPVKSLRKYYFNSEEKPAPGPHSSELPVFAIFVTDGDCNSQFKNAAELQFRYASQFPVFFKVLALRGKQESAVFDLLNKLDDAPVIGDKSKVSDNLKHYIDNVDFVQLNDPDDLNIDLLLKEYLGYLHQAHTEKGLLDQDPNIDVSKIDDTERMKAAGQQKKSCCAIM